MPPFIASAPSSDGPAAFPALASLRGTLERLRSRHTSSSAAGLLLSTRALAAAPLHADGGGALRVYALHVLAPNGSTLLPASASAARRAGAVSDLAPLVRAANGSGAGGAGDALRVLTLPSAPALPRMLAGGPSRRRVGAYQRSVRGEAMAVEGHMDEECEEEEERTPPPSSMAAAAYSDDESDEAPLPSVSLLDHAAGGDGDDDDETAPLPRAPWSPAAASAAATEPHVVASAAADFVAHQLPLGAAADAGAFRIHYDAAGLLAGERAATAAAAATAERSPADAHSDALRRVRRTLERLRGDSVAPGGSSVERTTPAPPALSPRSAELLGSLAAFRAGLQTLERSRRDDNAALRRDPAAAESPAALLLHYSR